MISHLRFSQPPNMRRIYFPITAVVMGYKAVEPLENQPTFQGNVLPPKGIHHLLFSSTQKMKEMLETIYETTMKPPFKVSLRINGLEH
jgi:hypothetical protein